MYVTVIIHLQMERTTHTHMQLIHLMMVISMSVILSPLFQTILMRRKNVSLLAFQHHLYIPGSDYIQMLLLFALMMMIVS